MVYVSDEDPLVLLYGIIHLFHLPSHHSLTRPVLLLALLLSMFANREARVYLVWVG
jgi:hypothetical protein